MTSPASIVAITDMRPPQRGQASTSRSKTRRIRSAQAQSRGFSGARGRLSSGGDTAPGSGVRSKAPAPGSSPARGRFSIVDPAEPRATTWARARACGARIPSSAREPSAERAAGQELSELALDEPRQTAPIGVRGDLGAKGLEVLAHHPMEDGALHGPGLVAGAAHTRRPQPGHAAQARRGSARSLAGGPPRMATPARNNPSRARAAGAGVHPLGAPRPDLLLRRRRPPALRLGGLDARPRTARQ